MLSNLACERISEHVDHAKGVVAHRELVVTHDITQQERILTTN